MNNMIIEKKYQIFDTKNLFFDIYSAKKCKKNQILCKNAREIHDKRIKNLSDKLEMSDSIPCNKDPRKIKELNNEEHYVTLRLEYNGLNKNPSASPNLFEVQQYVTLENNRIISPSKKFSSYKYFNSKS